MPKDLTPRLHPSRSSPQVWGSVRGSKGQPRGPGAQKQGLHGGLGKGGHGVSGEGAPETPDLKEQDLEG